MSIALNVSSATSRIVLHARELAVEGAELTGSDSAIVATQACPKWDQLLFHVAPPLQPTGGTLPPFH